MKSTSITLYKNSAVQQKSVEITIITMLVCVNSNIFEKLRGLNLNFKGHCPTGTCNGNVSIHLTCRSFTVQLSLLYYIIHQCKQL